MERAGASDDCRDGGARHDAAVGADGPAHQRRVSERCQHAGRQHHDAGAGDGRKAPDGRQRGGSAGRCPPGTTAPADSGRSHIDRAGLYATGGREKAACAETSGDHGDRTGGADPAIPNGGWTSLRK